MENTVEKGNKAEEIAEKYLIGKGYKIIKKNFRFGKTGEIDIIANDNDILVFVEIRSKTSDLFGEPIDSMTPGKIKKIRKTAEGYLYINSINNQECRFDFISIDVSKSTPKIEHMPNAFW